MKATLYKSELVSGLSLIQTAAEKKTTMPILSNVLITAKEGEVTIASTDLEITSSASLKAEVKKRGSTTVNSKLFLDIARELPEGEVSIELNESERLTLSCQRSRFTMNGISSEEYPGLPGLAIDIKDKFQSGELLRLIDRTIYAVSTDDTRYNLTGVCFEPAKGGTQAVATDGHRLSLDFSPALKVKERAIVPRRGLLELKKLLELSDEIGLATKEGFLVAATSKFRLAVRLIDGEFPDYTQVIPSDKGVTAEIPADELTHSLRRVVLLATDKTKCVKLDFDKETLVISNSSPDLGEAKEEIPIRYTGKRMSVGFNARYMLDFLGSIPEHQSVTIELHGELGPGKFFVRDDEGYLSIIMPMRL
jgi:DNA polymerase-3 subunit beta